MSDREQRVRWLRGQIQAMLLRGDDVECLPYADELERLEADERAFQADVVAAWVYEEATS